MKVSNESKVGALVFVTGLMALVFAWVVGVQNPFKRTLDFYITYNFAGGIEVGSPVRVSGIKVGKVEKIDFFVPSEASGQSKAVALREPGSAENGSGKAVVPVRLQVSIRKDAAVGVRKDSRYYINLAGVIGDRYIEVTPGEMSQPQVQAGDVVAGVDPPRIDQLISQSFDLAGKIKEIIEENKGDLSKSIDLLYKLSGNINKTLAWVDQSKLFKEDLSVLVDNLIQITKDVRLMTDSVRTPEGERTLKLLHELLWRLEPLDSQAIRNFLQKEGLKTKFF